MTYTFPTLDIPAVEKYPVRIYDANLNWVAEYDDYISLTWIRRWRRPGEFSLKISRYNADGTERDIEPGYFVSMYRGGAARIARIDDMDISLDDRGKGSEIWSITGMDAKGLLSSRLTIAGISTGTGYDVQSGVAAETAIRYFITRNAISAVNAAGASDTNRNISQFELETVDGAKGGTISYQTRLQVLTDVIEEILLASSGIGYEVTFLKATKKFQINIRAGTDRSAAVQYNTLFGNLRSVDYRVNNNGVKTVAYVMGTGTGAARTVLEAYLTGYTTGLTRYETFVDGSATDNSTAQLLSQGNAVLIAIGSNQTMTFTIIEDNSFRYMTRDAAGDYDLGDLIKVVYAGIATLSGRIIEVNEAYSGNSAMATITLTIGTEISDLTRVVKAVNKKATTQARK
jgi:hypothetical protein